MLFPPHTVSIPCIGQAVYCREAPSARAQARSRDNVDVDIKCLVYKKNTTLGQTELNAKIQMLDVPKKIKKGFFSQSGFAHRGRAACRIAAFELKDEQGNCRQEDR